MIEYPNKIDLKKYSEDARDADVYYGLPKEVQYCKLCVISNQRPSSTNELNNKISEKKATICFDDEGICDACRFAEKKKKVIDWSQRELELKALCDRNRKSDGSYDCLIPGSGGKDSFYAAHILKYKFGMNPLTVTWAPSIYTSWGWENFQAWIHAGFDNLLITPNGRVHRLLTRLALENLLHPFQPFIIGQKALAPKLAKKYGINLIFYGENEAEYGNPVKEAGSAVRSTKYFTSSMNDIMLSGVSLSDLETQFNVKRSELQLYLPMNSDEYESTSLQTHYLGYYLKWHPQGCYYYAAEHGGFKPSPERTLGTYSKYNSIDDKIDDLHFYTTGVKFGIGRATYDASQEIRSGDITRDEGVALVRRYDHEYPSRFLSEILDYLSIPEKQYSVASKQFEQPIMDKVYFDLLCNNFRSPHLWSWKNNTWTLRSPLPVMNNQDQMETA